MPDRRREATANLAESLRGLTVDDVAALDDETLRAMLSLAVRAYVRRLSEGMDVPPFPEDAGVTATDVVVVASEMLDAVEVEVFELGMWRSWGRI